MKKLVFYFISFILVFLVHFNVNAETYTLYNNGQKGTAETDLFTYTNFYNTYENDNSDYLIIEGIKNNTQKQEYLSFEIGFFDAFGENIGVYNYCSKSDHSTEYESVKINGQETLNNFRLDIKYNSEDQTKSYITINKTLFDIYSIAILSDNDGCSYGYSDKYIGKTIDEITNKVPTNSNYKKNSNMYLILFILGITFVYIFTSYIINTLYRRGHGGDGNILCYIPIVRDYMGAFVCFGPIIAGIYMIIPLYCSYKYLVTKDINSYLLYLVATIIIFIIIIIKIIAKNYEFLYLDINKIKDIKSNGFSNKQTITYREEENSKEEKQDKEESSSELLDFNISNNDDKEDSNIEDSSNDSLTNLFSNTYDREKQVTQKNDDSIDLVSQSSEDNNSLLLDNSVEDKNNNDIIDNYAIQDININQVEESNDSSSFVNPVNSTFDSNDFYSLPISSKEEKEDNINIDTSALNNMIQETPNNSEVKEESSVSEVKKDTKEEEKKFSLGSFFSKKKEEPTNNNDSVSISNVNDISMGTGESVQEEIKPIEDIKIENNSTADDLFNDINSDDEEE